MAPLPRFHKLEEEKRDTILEVAAQEFLEQGFDAASFNRIIERAGISKGAMYYYFKDKSDLYNTVLEGLVELITRHIGVVRFDEMTADNFWDELAKIQEKKLGFVVEHPWLLRLWGVGLQLMRQDPTGVMKRIYSTKTPMMHLWLERGRELGVVRDDIPLELQLRVMMGMGMAMGDWLVESAGWSEDELRARGKTFLEMLRQTLTPPGQFIYKNNQEESDERAG